MKTDKAQRLLLKVLKRLPAAKDLIRFSGMWGDDDAAFLRAPQGRWWTERAGGFLEQDAREGTKKAEQRLLGAMHSALLALRERQQVERGRAVEQALLARAQPQETREWDDGDALNEGEGYPGS